MVISRHVMRDEKIGEDDGWVDGSAVRCEIAIVDVYNA